MLFNPAKFYSIKINALGVSKREKNSADWNWVGGRVRGEMYLLLLFLLEKQRQPSNENASPQ